MTEAGVHTLISAAARAHPERAAVVSGTGEISYRELELSSDRLCERLMRDGLTRQSVVGLHATRGPGQVVALLAVLKAGCAYLPLDPSHPAERLRYMVRDAGVRWVLTGPGAGRPQDWPVTFLEVPAGLPEGNAEPEAGAARGVHPDELAYVIYTSGTTGRPKAVEVTHGNVLNLVRGLEATAWRGTGHSRVVWNASASFDASVQQWTRLTRGDTLIALDEETRADPVRLVDFLVAHRATDLDVVPSHLAHLLEPLAAAGIPLRVLVGGEPLSRELWDTLVRMERGQGMRAWNVYGPTECTVDSTVAPVTEGPPELGEPLPLVRAYVLGPDLAPVPDGTVGELFIAGQGVARGYRALPGRTAAAFLPDPVAGDGGRMYRTGDLVRRGSQRRLDFVRRRDRQVKVRGHRVELGEVEAALSGLRHVMNAAATLRTDLPSGSGIVAYAVLNAPVQPDELRAQLRGLLPAPMLPAAVVVLDSLPTGPSGKVDHDALPRPSFGEERERAPLTSDTERTVADIWAEVLKCSHIGADDDFFALGGDSLSMGRVINRCRERFGLRISPRTVFDNPKLRDFARAVQHAAERS